MQKEFQIPSNFQFLNDVNPIIFKILITKHEYTVKSRVNEEVFESFINHWINKQIPIITFENFSQFDELSQEFQRMEDIVQLFRDNAIEYLLNQNQTLKRKFKEKIDNLDEKNMKYDKILNYLFKNNRIDSYLRFLIVKKDLYNACKKENEKYVYLLTRKEIKHIKSGLSFALDEKELKAGVFNCNTASGDVIIPLSINYKSRDYIVTKIHEDAFKNSKDIRSIQFPIITKLNIIAKSAFFQSSLEQILIPSSVTEIDDFAFCECNQLHKVEFAKNSKLQQIGKAAFCKSSIESINFPSSLMQIGDFAFSNCEHLKIVEFANNSNLKCIGCHAFSFSSIEKISIPSSVSELQEGWCSGNSNLINVDILTSEKQNITLYDNKYIVGKTDQECDKYDVLLYTKQNITNLIIPSFIKRIAPYAFGGCNELNSITFLNDSELKEIDKNAFINSDISKLTIPSSVFDLKEGWCCGTLNLTRIKICSNNCQNVQYIDDTFIIGKSNIRSSIFDVLLFARRDITDAIIPSFIKTIAPYAFHSCMKLKNVVFSKDSKLQSIGSYSFCNSALKTITIPEKVTSIGERSFSFCKSLKRINFSYNSRLNEIESYAFADSSIKCILIPSQVMHIGEYAFANCDQFQKIEFSHRSELKTIDKKAFSNSSIDSLLVPSNVTGIGDLTFSKCENLQIIEIVENSKLSSINKSMFNKSSLKLVMIPTTLKKLVEL